MVKATRPVLAGSPRAGVARTGVGSGDHHVIRSRRPPTPTTAPASRARVPDTAVDISRRRSVARLRGVADGFAASQHHPLGLQTDPVPKLTVQSLSAGRRPESRQTRRWKAQRAALG